MLQNPKYNGKVTHSDKVYDNIFPKLIDDVTWQRVQDIAAENKHAPGRKKDIYDFILSGKLVCGDCGHMMVGESGTSKTGDVHYYYSCLTNRRRHEKCENTHSIRKDYLENLVINTTWELLSNDELLHSIAVNIVELHKKESEALLNLKSLEARRQTALKASQNLIAAIEMGIITEQTKVRLKELETQISQLDFDIEQEKRKSYTYLREEDIEKYFHSIICGDINGIDVRKAIVKTFIREIIVYKDQILIVYNFTEHPGQYKISKESVEIIDNLSSYKSIGSAPQANNTNSEIQSKFVLFFAFH